MPGTTIVSMEREARAEIGYRECPKRNGRCIFSGGTEVAGNHTKFGDEYKFNGVAWCAIFLSMLAKHNNVLYLGKLWRFASTVSARDHAKKNKRWTTTPTVGTFAMMAHTSTTGHIGFVIYLIRRNGVLIVGTIEGNTNDQGSREGNGVWLRERVASSWDGYIILDETYTSIPPVTPIPSTPKRSTMEAEIMDRKAILRKTPFEGHECWDVLAHGNRDVVGDSSHNAIVHSYLIVDEVDVVAGKVAKVDIYWSDTIDRDVPLPVIAEFRPANSNKCAVVDKNDVGLNVFVEMIVIPKTT